MARPLQMWDVFVSHASEDKEEVAGPLARELRGRGLRVWYDEYELKVGDSLLAKINEGLAQSRHAVVVLSPEFFAKHWTNEELNGLAALEAASGEYRVLPVWHKLSSREVAEQAPMIAARLAATTAIPIDELAMKLVEAMGASRDRRSPAVAVAVELGEVAGEQVELLIRNVSSVHASGLILEPREVSGRGVPLVGSGPSTVLAGSTGTYALRRFEPDGTEAVAVWDLLYSDPDERVLKRQRLTFSLAHDVVTLQEHVSLSLDQAEPEQTFLREGLEPWPEHADNLAQAFLFADGWLLTGSTAYLRALRTLEGVPPEGPL